MRTIKLFVRKCSGLKGHSYMTVQQSEDCINGNAFPNSLTKQWKRDQQIIFLSP